MRRLRPLLLIGLAGVIVLAVIMIIPTSRFLVLGAVRGENFHGDRPVSHWEYLLEDENENVRKHACYCLGQMGEDSRKAVPAIGRALKDPSDIVRITAALALSKIGASSVAALDALAEALTDPHPQVRLNSALAITKIGREARSVVPALIAAIDRKENGDIVPPFAHSVRQQCALALGKMGPEARAAVPALVEMLSDSSPGCRRDAARVLGEIGPESRLAVPKLKRCVEEDDFEEVRRQAEAALKAIGPA